MAKNKKQATSGEMAEKMGDTQIVPQTIANFNVENLMAKAIATGMTAETMEKFLVMRQQLKAEWAKEQFDQAMANFQAECPTIEKKKQGYNYKYAPLESIVEQVKGLLAKYGFSYTFDTTEGENAIVVYCKVKHVSGYSETSQIQISKETTTKMNASQQSGAATTYGKRYAFLNAFGILTGDEDNDAATPLQKVIQGEGLSAKLKRMEPTDDEKVVKLYQKDLENCQTIQEWEQVCANIKIGVDNGKISDWARANLVKIAAVIKNQLDTAELAKDIPFESKPVESPAAKIMNEAREAAIKKMKE